MGVGVGVWCETSGSGLVWAHFGRWFWGREGVVEMEVVAWWWCLVVVVHQVVMQHRCVVRQCGVGKKGHRQEVKEEGIVVLHLLTASFCGGCPRLRAA